MPASNSAVRAAALSATLSLLACPATTSTAPASTAPPAPPPTGFAVEPAVSAFGSDVSDLPRLYPHGDWVPLVGPLLSMQVVTSVEVNGRTHNAVLDTGAMGTTLSEPVAQRLGLLDAGTPRGAPVRAVDAHGDVIIGEKVKLGALRLGRHTWSNVTVTVLGKSPDLFLVGADLLQEVDLYIAADEALVGVFPAGAAPRRADERVVKLDRSDRQLMVSGAADGRERTRFPLLIDTGAWNTSVPASIGINGGIPADLTFSAITVGVAGEQETRGRFLLRPLLLGADDIGVGRVLAIASTLEGGEGFGLLGNDVFMRFHTIVSFRDRELRMRPLVARTAARTRGPAAAACVDDRGSRVPCISVALVEHAGASAPDDLPGVCMQIDVDRAFAGQTIELAITADDADDISLWNGGAIRAYLSVDGSGSHHCFTLWRQLDRLQKANTPFGPGAPLTLRWVRTEGVQWPCDPMKTRCITFTGPLATLPTK